MNRTALRALLATITLITLSITPAFASERERIKRLCETSHRHMYTYDCECYADAFVTRKATMGEMGKYDQKVFSGISDKCRKTGRLDMTYAGCMSSAQTTTTSMANYCQCIVDEMRKRPYPAENNRANMMAQMQNNTQSMQVCQNKYLSQVNINSFQGEQKKKVNTVHHAYKNTFDNGHDICTDYGVAPGQSAEKTKLRQYVNSFCPDIKDIMNSSPVTEIDRIIEAVQKIEYKMEQTYDAQISSLSNETRAYLQACGPSIQDCKQRCQSAHKLLNFATCGCGEAKLYCLGSQTSKMQ
ncbi:MAG: hypothetical protein H6860_03265 [Rhodospirillales bacterium]|nr:hypothetical protein [Rhodospirillales bacterium]